jgi:hypothetical protein
MRHLAVSLGLLALLVAPFPCGPHALAIAAPPKPAATPVPLALPAGTSLATATGTRLFPRLVGEPMPGWLQAYGGTPMGAAYEGYHEEATLPDGHRLVVMRTQDRVGSYVLKQDRCVGQLLFEPQTLDAPETLAVRLRRLGFRARTGLLATRDRGYGAHATRFERRRGALVEQYMLFDLSYREETVLKSRTVIGAEACFPARLAPALAGVIVQGTAALAEFCRTEEQRARQPQQ